MLGVGEIGGFKNVKWCPSARHDLVSVSALHEVLGCRTILDESDGSPVKLVRNSDNVSGGRKLNGLYYLDYSILKRLSDCNLSTHENLYYLSTTSTEINLASSNITYFIT